MYHRPEERERETHIERKMRINNEWMLITSEAGCCRGFAINTRFSLNGSSHTSCSRVGGLQKWNASSPKWLGDETVRGEKMSRVHSILFLIKTGSIKYVL